MNEKQRAEFEKWMMFEGVKHVAADTMFLNGKYVFPETRILALCWQAAIASVVVTIPDWSEYDTPRQAIDACAERIKDAGLNC